MSNLTPEESDFYESTRAHGDGYTVLFRAIIARLDADGVHLARALVDRDDGRLGQDDPAPSDVHEGVRGPEVDGHVAADERR